MLVGRCLPEAPDDASTLACSARLTISALKSTRCLPSIRLDIALGSSTVDFSQGLPPLRSFALSRRLRAPTQTCRLVAGGNRVEQEGSRGASTTQASDRCLRRREIRTTGPGLRLRGVSPISQDDSSRKVRET